MSQQTSHHREVAQATLQGPRGPLPFSLFKTDVSFQVANSIFAGATYPTISFVPDVKTIVDIGANVGAASVYFAIAYPDAEVYAFEPGSAPLSLLQQNVEPLRNVTVFPLAFTPANRRCLCFTARTTAWNRPCVPASAPTARARKFVWCARLIFSPSTASTGSMY